MLAAGNVRTWDSSLRVDKKAAAILSRDEIFLGNEVDLFVAYTVHTVNRWMKIDGRMSSDAHETGTRKVSWLTHAASFLNIGATWEIRITTTR